MTDGRPCYVAEYPELPGCVGYGDTEEAARASLEEAKTAYLDALGRAGGTAPSPSQPEIIWRAMSIYKPAVAGPARKAAFA